MTTANESSNFIARHGLVKYKYANMNAGIPRIKECEIPGCLPKIRSGKSTRYVFDHCHKHGWIRGILCEACNYSMSNVDANNGRHVVNFGYSGWTEGDKIELLNKSPHLEKFYLNCPDCVNGLPATPGSNRNRKACSKCGVRRVVYNYLYGTCFMCSDTSYSETYIKFMESIENKIEHAPWSMEENYSAFGMNVELGNWGPDEDAEWYAIYGH